MKLRRKNPSLRHIGQLLISSQEAANYLAKMKFEAGAIEPPCKTLPGPEVGGRTAGDPRRGVQASRRGGQPSSNGNGHQGRLSVARSTSRNPPEMHRGRGTRGGVGWFRRHWAANGKLGKHRLCCIREQSRISREVARVAERGVASAGKAQTRIA